MQAICSNKLLRLISFFLLLTSLLLPGIGDAPVPVTVRAQSGPMLTTVSPPSTPLGEVPDKFKFTGSEFSSEMTVSFDNIQISGLKGKKGTTLILNTRKLNAELLQQLTALFTTPRTVKVKVTTAGGVSNTVDFMVENQPPESLVVTPKSQMVPRGNPAVFAILWNGTAPVDLKLESAPFANQGTFSVNPVPAGQTSQSTLTLQTTGIARGTYTLTLSGTTESATTIKPVQFQLKIEKEPGNANPCDPIPINFGGQVNGVIDKESCAGLGGFLLDVYEFETQKASQRVEITVAAQFACQVTLATPNGIEIESKTNAGSTGPIRIVTTLSTQTAYRIILLPTSPGTNQGGAYTLTLK